MAQKKHLLFSVSAFVAFLTLLFATAHAATFTVTNTNDSGPGSLRDAISRANATLGADTVNFDAAVTGTILLTTGPIKISDAVSIVGPGASVLAIDGNANGRIFTVFVTDPACPTLDGPDYLVWISGLRLTNARNTTKNAGGAIYSVHSLAFDWVIFDNNVSGEGGAVWDKLQYPGQTLTITNSQFLNNVAKPVLATPGFPHVAGALGFEDRCANAPGAPLAVTIANSVFSGNSSQPVALNGVGGAIGAFATYADIAISDTRIVDNHVDVPNPPVAGNVYRGGALWGKAKSLTIVRSEISDNSTNATSSVTQGGAIAFFNFDPNLQTTALTTAFNIINSTISGNTDSAFGGGLWVYGNVAVNVDNSTISNNTAPATHGGGIFVTTGPTLPVSANNALAPTLTIVSSIVADNSADDVASGAVPAFTINATNSLTGTICSTCNISIAGSGNLSGVDPMLDELDFNGGPTRTQALLLGSPAIAAGSNPLNLATDQRGPGFPREVNGATDIGAYQFQPSEMFSELIADVTDLHFKQAIGLLTNASQQFDAGNVRPACNDLNAFINQVQAQTGKQLTVSSANGLITAADQIRAALDCN
jgi:hypothetical protein